MAAPAESPILESIRRHLEGLKQSADGQALYMMIERGLKRYGQTERIEEAFGQFLKALLERYTKDARNDPATRVKARLILQRFAQLTTPPPVPSERPAEHPETRPFQEKAKTASVHAELHGTGLPKDALPIPEYVSPAVEIVPPAAPPAVAAPVEQPRAEPLNVELEQANEAIASIPPIETAFAPSPEAPVPDSPAPSSSTADVHEPAERPEIVIEEIEIRARDDEAGEVPIEAPASENVERLGESLAEDIAESLTVTADGDFLEQSITPPGDGPVHFDNKRLSGIGDLKQLLVQGIDELIREREALQQKLTQAAEYVKAVEHDRKKLKNELGRVRKHSLADELTGLPKREVFVKHLESEVGRVRRYGFALTLAMIDIDGLEVINSNFGRGAGDCVLRSYATDILGHFRSYDLVARYGEDEFVVLFPNTQKEGAWRALEKAQKLVTETFLSFEDKSFPLPRFSSVLTLYSQGEKASVLLARADEALHRAKLLGPNRHVVALPTA